MDGVGTPNRDGDRVNDALAAQLGRIRLATGANIGNGGAVFGTSRGTEPGYAGQDKGVHGSTILCGETTRGHLGWHGVADVVVRRMNGAIGNRQVTYDFPRVLRNLREEPRAS